jgi:hypothetical protein
MKGGIEMTEDEKQQVAVFRFGVISDFVNRSQLNGAQRRRLLADKCALFHQNAAGQRQHLAMDQTLHRQQRPIEIAVSQRAQ